MFVALEHMQVCFVTARRTGLTKVRKNVISFAQGTPAFAQRVGLMGRYEIGDRVNSRLGPEMALDTTEGRLKHLVSASDEERRLLVADESGSLVWPATVKEVSASGQLVLTYDHGFGEGLVELTHLTPRVRMPWHPKFLKGVYTLMLRRNLGRGRLLEGLELRWGLVSNILHALTALGRWRLDGSIGPMHKWYDPRAFDLLSHTEIMAQRAVDSDGAALPEARTGPDLASVGLDIRIFGDNLGGDDGEGAPADDDGPVEGEADVEVSEAVFCRWLERAEFLLGSRVARWWVDLEAGASPFGDDEPWKQYDEETAADLYVKFRGELLPGEVFLRACAGAHPAPPQCAELAGRRGRRGCS